MNEVFNRLENLESKLASLNENKLSSSSQNSNNSFTPKRSSEEKLADRRKHFDTALASNDLIEDLSIESEMHDILQRSNTTASLDIIESVCTESLCRVKAVVERDKDYSDLFIKMSFESKWLTSMEMHKLQDIGDDSTEVAFYMGKTEGALYISDDK